MAALKKRYYPKIDEEVYSAILDNGMSLSIIKKKGFVEKVAFLSTNFGALDNHFYMMFSTPISWYAMRVK